MNKEQRPRLWRAFRWHALFLAILTVECLAAILYHRTHEELRVDLQEKTGREQVQALFVLTNRGVPDHIDNAVIDQWLESENTLIREWIMTINFSRFAANFSRFAANFSRFAAMPIKKQYISTVDDPEEATRCRFLLDHQIGRGNAMKLSDLEQFLDGG